MRICWTCSRARDEAEALTCKRPYCSAKREAERDVATAQRDAALRRVAEQDKPDHYDSWSAARTVVVRIDDQGIVRVGDEA